MYWRLKFNLEGYVCMRFRMFHKEKNRHMRNIIVEQIYTYLGKDHDVFNK
jgi:hypothetical protein